MYDNILKINNVCERPNDTEDLLFISFLKERVNEEGERTHYLKGVIVVTNFNGKKCSSISCLFYTRIE